jgi:hypothetical protein
MTIKLNSIIAAGVLIAGTAAPVFAIPATLPIDYRVGGVPAGSSATGIVGFSGITPIVGAATVTQNSEGLGVNSPSSLAFLDDNGEVGPFETLTVALGAPVTGVWVLQLFDEFFDDQGTIKLYDASNALLNTFTFSGTGNLAPNGEKYIDFLGAIAADHATFSAPGGIGSNKDYSVAGFTTAAPDGGTNLMLLGSALSVLGWVRRKFLS